MRLAPCFELAFAPRLSGGPSCTLEAMYLTVWSTVPNAETGQRIARTIVHEGLAACVSLLPGVTSVYRWQGEVQQNSEHLLFIKTTLERYTALETRIRELHPYEVPEIIAHKIEAGLSSYLEWIAENSR